MENKPIFSDIEFVFADERQKQFFRSYGKKIDIEGCVIYQLLNGQILIDEYKEDS